LGLCFGLGCDQLLRARRQPFDLGAVTLLFRLNTAAYIFQFLTQPRNLAGLFGEFAFKLHAAFADRAGTLLDRFATPGFLRKGVGELFDSRDGGVI
jgi:hypothetical protein